MKQTLFSRQTLVSEALDAAPSISALFIARRTACVGCALARFCTLADAAHSYAIPLDSFVHELERAALLNPSLTEGVPHEEP